jgi:hypothetical protein
MQESDLPEGEAKDTSIHFKVLEGEQAVTRSVSERYWAQKGWTSNTINGMYVGCPELPDGSEYYW